MPVPAPAPLAPSLAPSLARATLMGRGAVSASGTCSQGGRERRGPCPALVSAAGTLLAAHGRAPLPVVRARAYQQSGPGACVRACVRDAPPAGRTSALPCVGRAGARGREAGSCCVRRALAALIAPSPAAGAACVCAGKEAANTLARSLSLSLFLSLLASCPRALPACVQTETARHGSTGPTQPERAAHTLWPVARMAEPRAARGAWWSTP